MAAMTTHFPTTNLPTKFGTLRALANGGVQVSNNRQYDRKTEGLFGEPNGVTDLIVRGIPYEVRINFRIVNGEVLMESNPWIKRGDAYLKDPSDAAKKTIKEECLRAVSEFIVTSAGAAFVASGVRQQNANAIERAEVNLAEARRMVTEAEEALAALWGEVEASLKG